MTDDDDHRPDERRAPESARDARTGRSAAFQRSQHQQAWVDQQLRVAQERGDFDDLPGFGKPLEGLGAQHDPDWWIKGLIEREKLAVLPPAMQLRKEDAELDAQLDSLATEELVRRAVAEFNERVRHALYTTHGGPPITTPQRDPDAEVARWRERRSAQRSAPPVPPADEPTPRSRRTPFWRRRPG